MNPRFISTTQHPSPNPYRSRTFTVNFFGAHITTEVTSTPVVARQWVYNLRSNNRNTLQNSELVVGLGVQWRPSNYPIAATLQLCMGQECLIFHLSHADNVPATLRRLLEDDRVTFVGVHNGRDKKVLEESWAELEVRDLVDLPKDEGFGNTSMENMCSEVLGLHGVVKPREVGLSDWDEFWLSTEQVQYACVDAYVACLLAVELGYPYDDYDDEEEDYDDSDDSDDDGGYWGYGFDDYEYDDVYLDYDDYINPFNYNANWNYIG